jgi:hypothetical protein
MPAPKDALKTALRVLTALGDKHQADPADVAELQRLAPSLADTPLDELACEVIQQALRQRAEVRARVRDN